jgi:hypothetical protein
MNEATDPSFDISDPKGWAKIEEIRRKQEQAQRFNDLSSDYTPAPDDQVRTVKGDGLVRLGVVLALGEENDDLDMPDRLGRALVELDDGEQRWLLFSQLEPAFLE